jgi:hypothetical protein
VNMIVIIVKEYHGYQLHAKFYPVFFCQINFIFFKWICMSMQLCFI